jgi:hypothetical protein
MNKCYEKCPIKDCRNGTIPSLSWFILCKCYDCIHGLDGPIHETVQSHVKESVLKLRKAREDREGKKLYSDYYNPIKGQFDPEVDIDFNEEVNV